MTTRKQIYQAKTLQQLEILAKAAGYSYGWAQKVFNARQRKK